MRNSANARPEFLPSREKRIWREKWKPAVVWKCEVIGSRCLRSRSATLSLEDALRVSRQFIDHYNTVRLHSGIGYVTPQDKLLGRDKAILHARDEKLQQAREHRKQKRAAQAPP